MDIRRSSEMSVRIPIRSQRMFRLKGEGCIFALETLCRLWSKMSLFLAAVSRHYGRMQFHRDYLPLYPPSPADPKNYSPVEAKWIPLPASTEACPYSGLKRSHLVNLIRKHPTRIRGANLIEAGARKGRWVIWWPSLHAFLETEAAAICVRLRNLDR